jgi:hypothetical protein
LEEQEALGPRQPQEVSQRGRRAPQEALRPEQWERPEKQAVLLRFLPQRLAFSAQTALSVNSQAAAFLPDRWP